MAAGGAGDPGSAEACADCHAEAAAQWRGSRHAVAGNNAIFAVALDHADHRSWCTGCHTPDEARPDEGIGCATCHLRAGERHPDGPDPDLASGAVCAGCHQFGLPAGHALASDEPVQTTVDEWADSLAALEGRTCVSCHADGDHRMTGAHDPDRVRGALRITVEPREEGLRMVLVTKGVGHRLPTGDGFRRLVVEACADETCADVIARRVLGRRFDGPAWHLVEDRWLPPDDEVTIDLAAPGARGWRVSYAYGDPLLEPLLAPEDRGFVVASGAVPLAGQGPSR